MNFIGMVENAYSGRISGLGGDANGNGTDDLKPQGSGAALPVNAGLQALHNKFGETWRANQLEYDR